jgi:hypothetical protein
MFLMLGSILSVSSLIETLYTRRLGGTVGAIVTCPLEVVKTRLQSTHYSVGSGNHWAVMQFVKYVT